MENFLTSDQRNDLAVFREISGITDDELAVQVLETHDWNLERAVNEYSLRQEDHDGSRVLPSDNTTRHTAATSSTGASSAGNPWPRNPSDLLGWSLGLLGWVFSTRRVLHSPDEDSQRFVGRFEQSYQRPPRLFSGSYQAAVRQANLDSKFLLIYLHSDLHENVDEFCREVLCAPNIVRYIDNNFLFWAGSVSDVEAYALTYQLKCKSFPFLSVLLCQSESLVQILDTMQGMQRIYPCIQRGMLTYYLQGRFQRDLC